MKTALYLLAGVLAVFGIALMVPIRESYTEVDTVTGATRTRDVRFGLLNEEWREKRSWLAEMARREGIRYEPQWKIIGHHTHHLTSMAFGCSRNPTPAILRGENPPRENLESFARNYLASDEKGRERLIQQLEIDLSKSLD